MDRGEIGRRGEEYAARYLKERGYRIVKRNFRAKVGEIDIVAVDGDELVFVEVRYRSSAGHGTAAETVNPRKRRRLVRAASLFLLARGASDTPCRFDVVALQPGRDGGIRLEHHRNAFDSEGHPFG